MYKTLTIQSNNEADLALIRQLAERLGLRYQETEVEKAELPSSEEEAEEENEPIASLLDGLNLPKHSKPMRYEDIPEKVDFQTKLYEPDYHEAKRFFGSWEDDDDESLEDLLNMLTP